MSEQLAPSATQLKQGVNERFLQFLGALANEQLIDLAIPEA